ncbi:hypothetical protein Fmac_020442 [Flemingia macrophylla]|uniref:E2F/DP family winged-helix DNA-binding domain-containing protein n=1 Tax=Flemingia macrophylla TaxID=520843 RepID=A0ABD1LTZ9_9FABA
MRTVMTKKKRGQRAVGGDKSGRGLRQFSMKVCEKVESKGRITYNEVADELVAEFVDPSNGVSTPDQQQYDEKNIRRRVYDALNVLIAMDIISKDKKEIQWKGLPRTSLSDIEELKEACRLLPEIIGPASHPKIVEVLLERGSPDTTLMVLRWAGRDGEPHMTSLRDVVTAVRVRVECGLLTEAFMHQRVLCTRVKENNFNKRASADTSEKLKGQLSNWVEWVEVLVIEICFLCIRRNLVDWMIDLPWNSEEENAYKINTGVNISCNELQEEGCLGLQGYIKKETSVTTKNAQVDQVQDGSTNHMQEALFDSLQDFHVEYM